MLQASTISCPTNSVAQRNTILRCEPDLISELNRCGLERGWWPAELHWKRCFERYDPDQAPYCTLAYECPDNGRYLAVIELGRANRRLSNSAVTYHRQLGPATIWRFVDDPLLPGIGELLANFDPVTAIRYRPHHRCTLRVDSATQRPRYAKVFTDRRGKDIYCDARRLWKCHKRGRLGFSVAEPLGWNSSTRTYWQRAIQGQPIRQGLYGVDGRSVARAIGTALASLASCTIQPLQKFDGALQLKRSLKYFLELERRLPSQRERLHRLHKKLLHCVDIADPHQLFPIHGSPHSGQWLLHGNGLALVDFDRFALGDPELDAATFINELEFSGSSIVSTSELVAAFNDGFESAHGRLRAPLVAAYLAHKKISKALKALRSLSPKAETKAIRNIGFALDCSNKTGEYS